MWENSLKLLNFYPFTRKCSFSMRGQRRIYLCLGIVSAVFFRWEDACGENDCIDEHRDMARTFEPGAIGEGTTLGEGNFPLHPFGGAKLRLLRRRGAGGFT